MTGERPALPPTAQQRAHAIRVVAANADDAAELVELLGMLGLDADEIRHPRPVAAIPVQRHTDTVDRHFRGRMVAQLADGLTASGR